MIISLNFRPNAKKPVFDCPNCGNDWLYGWEKPSQVQNLLAGKVGIRCSKCRAEFAYEKK